MSLEPRWIIPIGAGCNLGITIDDGCYVILFPDSLDPECNWKSRCWIPPKFARILGILAFLGTIEKEYEEILGPERTRRRFQ